MSGKILLVPLIVLILAGCNPSGTTVRKETHKDDKSTVEETTRADAAERETYQKEMQQHLDELQKEIGRWHEKINQAGAGAREEMKVQLKNLEKQREVAAERLHELSKSSQAAWGPMKEGFHRAFDELKDAFHKARERFKEKEGGS
jgi:septal ring factor EnvC (AmiA/AmiB activator)